MKRNVRLMVLAILALFLMPLVVNAEPLESFAENPIPYWEDDSIDVDVSWSEEQQTVDFDLSYPEWEEDFWDVSDWIEKELEADDDTGTVAGIGFLDSIDSGGGDAFDKWYTNAPNITAGNYYYKVKWKLNATNIHYWNLYSFVSDGPTGAYENLLHVVGNGGTDWTISEGYTTTGQAIESLRIQTRVSVDAPGPVKLEIEYIQIGPDNGTLDVGVPLEPDITQSVELMANFSALNSTVRFQMYDNTTASGLFCDVNSTQVTFPDATYAEFTEFARINFSLDEERLIFRIYVSAQNTTLINYYSFYVGLANKDYLRMNDSAFEGSYELWYLQGDLGYLEVTDTDNIFYLLFLSTEMWGYIGPIALVIIGYFVFKKDRILGILFFVVECLFIANYIALVSVTPDYWWHIVILLFGGLFTCVFPLWDR